MPSDEKLLELVVILALLAITVSLVLYLRAQSLKQFERACQARMDALRSAAELREMTARTCRTLRDAALDEVSRVAGLMLIVVWRIAFWRY